MGAEYLYYMKFIETHARTFLALIILPIGTVNCVGICFLKGLENTPFNELLAW